MGGPFCCNTMSVKKTQQESKPSPWFPIAVNPEPRTSAPNTQPRANSCLSMWIIIYMICIYIYVCIDDCMLDYRIVIVVSSGCNWNLRCLAHVFLSPTAEVVNLPSHKPATAPIADWHRNTLDVRCPAEKQDG